LNKTVANESQNQSNYIVNSMNNSPLLSPTG